MAKRREPTAPTPVELKLDIPGQPQPAPQHVEGLDAELKFAPIPMEPRTPEAIFNNLMVRESCDPSGPTESLSPTFAILQRYVNGLTFGEDLSPIKNEILRIAQHQPEKADLFNAILNLIDQERIADAVYARGKCEKFMKRAVNRGDLTSQEVGVLWRMANGIISEIQDRQVAANKGVDTLTIIEKVNFRQQTVDSETMQKWKGTTPHGREIIRKKLYELKKEMGDINPPAA